MKPEIVFFGENLPEQFHRAMKYDKDEVDLLIVIGSSLKVRPVALIPSKLVMILENHFCIFCHVLWVCRVYPSDLFFIKSGKEPNFSF